jgi:phage baseplate assembly protein gpV
MATSVDDIVARLIERVEGRYYGKYRGTVTDNQDPDNLGRVKANVPRVLGDHDTGWALPAFIYGGASEQGFFAVPDVGAGVWIEFEGGDLSYPIWTGTWYTTGAIPESATPSKKVLKTTSGHKIVLDDDGGSVEVTDSNGNTISMDASVIKIQTSAATQVVIDGPQIQLVQDSEHPLVFGDNLLEYLNQLVELYQTHMHPGELALGVFPVTPAPPVPPFPPATPELISTRVTTG